VWYLGQGQGTAAISQGIGACVGINDDQVVEAQVIERNAQYRTTWIATR
jgi:hypothetical protein